MVQSGNALMPPRYASQGEASTPFPFGMIAFAYLRKKARLWPAGDRGEMRQLDSCVLAVCNAKNRQRKSSSRRAVF
jgi:hypothetical protein